MARQFSVGTNKPTAGAPPWRCLAGLMLRRRRTIAASAAAAGTTTWRRGSASAPVPHRPERGSEHD